MPAYTPPKKGIDPTPQTGNPFIGERRGGPDAAAPGGQEVLDRNSGVIDAWLAAQRNAVANSITNLHTAALAHPEFDATYQNHYGAETVTLSPKPQGSTASDQPVPPPGPPNDLPKLAEQEVVTPQTPLYLMVLYKGDHIAAVSMDSLATPSPTYEGICSKTTWGSGPIPTLQLKLDGTEFVMLPLDMTGTVAATTYWLMTNALGDAVATTGNIYARPLMAGIPTQLYTCGGQYAYHKGKFVLGRQLSTDLIPYAIDGDGTSYYPPLIGGSISVKTDAFFTSAFDLATQAALSQAETAASSGTGQQVYGFAYLMNYKYANTIYGPLGATHDTSTITTYSVVDIFQTGPSPVAVGISGYSYYGKGAYNGPPQVMNYRTATAEGAEINFDGTDFTIIQTGQGSSTDLSNTLPLLNSTKQGAVTVDLAPVTASQNQSDTLSFDHTQSAGVYAAGQSLFFQYGTTNGGDGASLVTSTNEQTLYGVRSSTRPLGPYTEAAVDAYYQTEVDYFASQNPGAHSTHTTGTIKATFPYMQEPTLEAPLTEIPDGYPLGDFNSITVGYYSSSSGEDDTLNGYASLGLPLTYPTKGGRTIAASVLALGISLTYSYSTEVTDPGSGSMKFYTFPPMLNNKPYVGIYPDGSGEGFHILTPYDNYTDASDGDFTGWLHVSNGDHLIQGYTIRNAVHAFLDGGTKDWLPALAKALNCATTEISSMVMDVTLAKIKAVAHVKGQG